MLKYIKPKKALRLKANNTNKIDFIFLFKRCRDVRKDF